MGAALDRYLPALEVLRNQAAGGVGRRPGQSVEGPLEGVDLALVLLRRPGCVLLTLPEQVSVLLHWSGIDTAPRVTASLVLSRLRLPRLVLKVASWPKLARAQSGLPEES